MKQFIRTISLLVILMLCTAAAVYGAPRDIQRHWSAVPVNTLIENGVMNGYPDERFRPDHGLTREEAASILAALAEKTEAELSGGEAVSAFSDVGERWSAGAIGTLAGSQILSGFPDGTFRPAEVMTREEFASMIDQYRKHAKGKMERQKAGDLPEGIGLRKNAADPGEAASSSAGISTSPGGIASSTAVIAVSSAGIQTSPAGMEKAVSGAAVTSEAVSAGSTGGFTEAGQTADEQVPIFWDVQASFARDAIESLCKDGILSGYSDGSFHPENEITRAEAAAVIDKLAGFEDIPPVVEIPEKNVIDVPYHSQVYPVRAMVGCEGTSLLMGLQGKGYAQNVDLWTFLNNLPRHSSNPAKGFVGSPFQPDAAKKTRTTIYPAKLAEYGSLYGKVTDLSGSSPKELQAEILAGNPVVAYETLWWEKPYYRYYNIEGQQQRLLSNNHVVLVCGYDSATNSYYIADPYNLKDPKNEYKYWIDGVTFEGIYNERRHAVAVES